MLCQPCDLGPEMVGCWSGAHPHVPSLPRPMHHVLFGPRPPSCPQPALHLSVQLSPPSSKSRRLRSPTTPLHLRLPPSSLARCLAHMYPACRTANPLMPLDLDPHDLLCDGPHVRSRAPRLTTVHLIIPIPRRPSPLIVPHFAILYCG